METKPQYIKRLRNELAELGSEIGKQIARLERLSAEIKLSYEKLETSLAEKQALTQATLQESTRSGDEVWHLVWDNIWEAVKESALQVKAENKQHYKELESALQSQQSALQGKLQVPKMLGEDVWHAVWNAVWNEAWSVVEEFNRQKAIEIKQVGEELQPLLDKQANLQAELHEVLMSGDAFYNILKGTTEAMLKGRSV